MVALVTGCHLAEHILAQDVLVEVLGVALLVGHAHGWVIAVKEEDLN